MPDAEDLLQPWDLLSFCGETENDPSCLFLWFLMDRYVMGESDTADCPPGGTPVESPDACPDEEVEQIDEVIG